MAVVLAVSVVVLEAVASVVAASVASTEAEWAGSLEPPVWGMPCTHNFQCSTRSCRRDLSLLRSSRCLHETAERRLGTS